MLITWKRIVTELWHYHAHWVLTKTYHYEIFADLIAEIIADADIPADIVANANIPVDIITDTDIPADIVADADISADIIPDIIANANIAVANHLLSHQQICWICWPRVSRYTVIVHWPKWVGTM
jgi:hypothetical protein